MDGDGGLLGRVGEGHAEERVIQEGFICFKKFTWVNRLFVDRIQFV